MSLHLKSHASGEYLNKLADHEKAVADLYEALAVAIPRAREFWRSLVVEEREHEASIRSVAERVAREELKFVRPDFRLDDIEYSIEFAATVKQTAEQEGMRMREAMEKAIAIEESMLESDWFNVVDADSEELKKEFEKLREDTEVHAEKLLNEQKRFKWKIFG